MPPDQATLLEVERERFRERQRQRRQHVRAAMVRRGCPTPTEDALQAEVEDRYGHLPAEERACIAQLAMAPNQPPKAEKEHQMPPAKAKKNAEKQVRSSGRLTNAQKERARKMCEERLAADPRAVGRKVWDDLGAAGMRMSEPTFYGNFWKPAKQRLGLVHLSNGKQAPAPDAGSRTDTESAPAVGREPLPAAVLEWPDGTFRAEIQPDGRRRIVMDLALEPAAADRVVAIVFDAWQRAISTN